VSPACARNCWYDGETELIGDPGSLVHQTLLPVDFGLRAIHVRLVTIDLILPAGDLELGGDGVLEFSQRVCAPAAGDALAICARVGPYSLNIVRYTAVGTAKRMAPKDVGRRVPATNATARGSSA